MGNIKLTNIFVSMMDGIVWGKKKAAPSNEGGLWVPRFRRYLIDGDTADQPANASRLNIRTSARST